MIREATPAEPAHVPVLDGIRGLAIILVMVIHLWCIWDIPPENVVDRVVLAATSFGWYGVDLFFALSGYLITGILLDAKGSEHYFRNFYLRRVLRIFPLYYLVLVIALYALPLALPPDKLARFGTIAGDEIYYWLYVSNFAMARAGMPRHGVLDVTWSLAIEEQFYFVWPAVVMLCSRRSLARIALALAAGSLLVRVGLHLWTSYNAFAVYVLTPSHLDGLAAGAVLAVLAREPGGLARLRRPARIAGLGALVLAIGIPVAEELTRPASLGVGMNPIFNTVGFTVLAVLFGALLVLVVTAEPGTALHRVFASSFLRTFGKYSYGLYLIHLPLRALIRDRLFGPAERAEALVHFPRIHGSELLGQLLFHGVAGAAALGVAWVSFQVFEKQFLKLKRFFPSGAAPDRLSAPRPLGSGRLGGPG